MDEAPKTSNAWLMNYEIAPESPLKGESRTTSEFLAGILLPVLSIWRSYRNLGISALRCALNMRSAANPYGFRFYAVKIPTKQKDFSVWIAVIS
jgi:hypothetical protein